MNREEQMTHRAIQASAKELGRVANAIEKLIGPAREPGITIQFVQKPKNHAQAEEMVKELYQLYTELPDIEIKGEKTNFYDDLGLDIKFPYPDKNLDGIKRLIADIYYAIGEFESETSEEDHNIIAGLKHLLELIAKGKL